MNKTAFVGLSKQMIRRPLAFTLAFLILVDATFLGSGFIAGILFPNASSSVLSDVSEGSMLALTLSILLLLRWFGAVGYNSTSKWKDLRVLWLPSVITVLFLLGLKATPSSLTGSDIIFFVVSAVLIGFSEETLFRGFALQGLLPYGTMQAVIGSSLIFGVFHFNNLVQARADTNLPNTLVQVAFTFLFGIGWASFRLRTNTIWPIVSFHALSDISSLIMSNSSVSPNSTFDASSAFLEIGLGIIMAVYGLYLIRRGKNSQHRLGSDPTSPPRR